MTPWEQRRKKAEADFLDYVAFVEAHAKEFEHADEPLLLPITELPANLAELEVALEAFPVHDSYDGIVKDRLGKAVNYLRSTPEGEEFDMRWGKFFADPIVALYEHGAYLDLRQVYAEAVELQKQ